MGQGCSRVGTEVSRSFNKFLPVSFFDRFFWWDGESK